MTTKGDFVLMMFDIWICYLNNVERIYEIHQTLYLNVESKDTDMQCGQEHLSTEPENARTTMSSKRLLFRLKCYL